MPLECDAKCEEKLTCGLENDIRNFANFQRTHEILKIGTFIGSFYRKQKNATLKLKGEICVVTMKNDAKFEIELTCHFKIDIRDLINLDPGTKTSQKFTLLWADFEESI